MNQEGLINIPRFNDPEFFLSSGLKTRVSELIENLALRAEGATEEEVAIDLLKKMNQVTQRLEDASNDPRKFKRNAEEILISGERTGCCDSSTLFTALLRARKIPAIQVIANNVPEALKDPAGFTHSHFFTAALLKGADGQKTWKIVDSDVNDENIDKKAHFDVLNQDDRNIDRYHYAFAYTRDYSDVLAYGKKINSIHNMLYIQRQAFARSSKDDMAFYKAKQEER